MPMSLNHRTRTGYEGPVSWCRFKLSHVSFGHIGYTFISRPCGLGNISVLSVKTSDLAPERVAIFYYLAREAGLSGRRL